MVHQYSCFVLENFHRCKSLLELSHIQVITLEVESSNPPFSTTFKAKIQDKERILTPTDCWRTCNFILLIKNHVILLLYL
ncbi:hypothetical protein IC575_002178 [Cucumis melo]